MHAIIHIVGREKIKKMDRDGLLSVVKMIQGMFEEELANPDSVAKRRSADIEGKPLLYKGSPTKVI